MTFKLKWWQLLIYEVAIISLGIFIGSNWSYFFIDYLYLLIALFAVTGLYTIVALSNQVDK